MGATGIGSAVFPLFPVVGEGGETLATDEAGITDEVVVVETEAALGTVLLDALEVVAEEFWV